MTEAEIEPTPEDFDRAISLLEHIFSPIRYVDPDLILSFAGAMEEAARGDESVTSIFESVRRMAEFCKMVNFADSVRPKPDRVVK